MKYLLLPITLILLVSADLFSQHPLCIPNGITGGSRAAARSVPTLSPVQSRLVAVSDMGLVFESFDDGATWHILPFQNLIPASPSLNMEATASPDTFYMVLQNFLTTWTYPAISTDGGYHWASLPGLEVPEHWYDFLSPDPLHTHRIVAAESAGIYFSKDAGNTFSYVSQTNDTQTAGTFWDGNHIYIADNYGILVSDNDGQSFSRATLTVPGGGFVSFMKFVGAKKNDITTLYGIADVDGTKQLLRFDRYGTGNFVYVPTNQSFVPSAFHLGIARDSPDIVWMAGTAYDGGLVPEAWRSGDGGQSWTPKFLRNLNQGVETGFMGYFGPFSYYWAEAVLDFWVNPIDPEEAIICDYSFQHRTRNGGEDWEALYVLPSERNPTGQPTPTDKFYHSNGFENTSVWSLLFASSDTLLAGMSDYGLALGIRDGLNWKWLPQRQAVKFNTIYCMLKKGDMVYAGASTLHDAGQTPYVKDYYLRRLSYDDLSDKFDHRGAVIQSADNGVTWDTLKAFKDPVSWIADDPTNPNTLYACLLNPDTGGVFRTLDLQNGQSALWQRLTDPLGTKGRPWNLRVLSDGTLIRSDFARQIEGAPAQFDTSAGVFVSIDGGMTWQNRSTPAMKKWVRDVVVHPAFEDIWVANVFAHWGCTDGIDGCGHTCFDCHEGGLYRTKDRGLHWHRVGDFYRTESVTWDINDPNLMFVTTEQEGLWVTYDGLADAPHFYLVDSYPFMHPVRVSQNPFDEREFYTTSFGNGIRRATLSSNETSLEISPTIEASIEANTICEGKSVVFHNLSSPNLTGLRWHFPDVEPQFSSQPNPEVVFLTPGMKTVELTVFNHVDTLKTTIQVHVKNKPVAAFSVFKFGQTYSFTDSSTFGPTSWFWDFGDSTNSTEQNPHHEYKGGSIFNVLLAVANECGADTVSYILTNASHLTKNSIDLHLSPVPATSRLTVAWNALPEDLSAIVIYDAFGRERMRFSDINLLLRGSTEIDLHGLSSGAYLICLNSANDRPFFHRTFLKL